MSARRTPWTHPVTIVWLSAALGLLLLFAPLPGNAAGGGGTSTAFSHRVIGHPSQRVRRNSGHLQVRGVRQRIGRDAAQRGEVT